MTRKLLAQLVAAKQADGDSRAYAAVAHDILAEHDALDRALASLHDFMPDDWNLERADQGRGPDARTQFIARHESGALIAGGAWCADAATAAQRLLERLRILGS